MWSFSKCQKDVCSFAVKHFIDKQYEPRHEKTCLCNMRTTKARAACASAQSDQRLCCSLPR